MKNLLQIHSRTEGTTSAAMLLLSLSCCNDKDCQEGGCRVRGRTLRTLSIVNSGEVASGEICFWWSVLLMFLLLMTCLQEFFFRLVSSDAVLQTHSSRCFKLQINSFALELVQSESLRIVLWLWILHTEGEKNHKKGGLNCVFGNFFFYVLDNYPQVQSLKYVRVWVSSESMCSG